MIERKNNYRVLGLMSGTSLDGLDIADCEYHYDNQKWSVKIYKAITVPYETDLLKELKKGIHLPDASIDSLHLSLGKVFADGCMSFDLEKIDFIASHGHTIKHRPDLGFTLQIGSAQIIADQTQKKVIADFRSLDVSLGGQGAPLVPIGDRDLFSEYDACINLGGFANISADINGKRLAWDICAVNVVLNRLAERLGHAYDDRGKIARSGQIIPSLFEDLNRISFYRDNAPKSLGMEWVEQEIFPLMERFNQEKTEDLIRTYVEHIAIQIVVAFPVHSHRICFSGGGTYHQFLIELVEMKTEVKIIIPKEKIIEYKEALIFGYLGVLNARGEINTLSSVTGATKNSIGGHWFKPNGKKH